MKTTNIISTSGGNDSIAMLLKIAELIKIDPVLFKDQKWFVVYFNTGWAKKGWDKRIDLVRDLCNKFNFEFVELKASALNKVKKTINDELFEMVPDEEHFGMTAFVKKKAFFPNVKMKYCTQELKIKPLFEWLKKNKFTPKNTTQWVGVRRAEGGRLGKNNAKDRMHTTSLGERDGFDVVYPICYLGDAERNQILIDNNIEIYNGRSEECYPCIFQTKLTDLANLDEDRIEIIHDLEVRITNYRKAKADLMGVENYNADEFFGMFRNTLCEGAEGIKAQVEYCKQKIKEQEKQGQQLDLFIIDDKCSSGYCGR
jgi:3'-phosphoadenosine 5'-phosphosulfate sulfotransferase (PAPS reductase)/FAD synthetase